MSYFIRNVLYAVRRSRCLRIRFIRHYSDSEVFLLVMSIRTRSDREVLKGQVVELRLNPVTAGSGSVL